MSRVHSIFMMSQESIRHPYIATETQNTETTGNRETTPTPTNNKNNNTYPHHENNTHPQQDNERQHNSDSTHNIQFPLTITKHHQHTTQHTTPEPHHKQQPPSLLSTTKSNKKRSPSCLLLRHFPTTQKTLFTTQEKPLANKTTFKQQNICDQNLRSPRRVSHQKKEAAHFFDNVKVSRAREQTHFTRRRRPFQIVP